MENNNSKILIFGGSGYIGRHVVNASIMYGHSTYVYTRPNSPHTQLLQHFQSMGVILVKGELNDHKKLVSIIREVDIVISVLPYPQVFEQFKIIEAIKVAGNIKRFLPADFGCEEDRIPAVLPPFQNYLNKKKAIRRAVEAAAIPYTFISANLCASYFINYLLRPFEPDREDITVYGDGKTNAVFNYEQDIGKYTIKVVNDPRTCNRVVIYRQKMMNMISQLELISRWETKTGRTFKRVFLPEEELVALSDSLPDPENIPVAILHSVFIKGITVNFEVEENDIEISTLYPDFKFTTVDELLDIFLHDPPEPASTPFA